MSIRDRSGLEGLTEIDCGIKILDNPSLTSLSALDNITYIRSSIYHWSGGITISNNPSLTNLDPLNNMTEGANIQIKNNSSLTSLDGLENLVEIDGSFSIESNENITDLLGLTNLQTISRHCLLYTSPSPRDATLSRMPSSA